MPAGSGWQVQAEAADFSASDATPVRGFAGGWAAYHPRSGRNLALQQARLELRLAHGGWELAATLRNDTTVSGMRGAFDVVHAYKQRLALADASRFDVAAQEQGVVWAGLRAARSWTLVPAAQADATGLRLSAALAPLRMQRMRTADVQGTAPVATWTIRPCSAARTARPMCGCNCRASGWPRPVSRRAAPAAWHRHS
ncbi:MAG: hypothetical protein QE285_01800 [Aquabacterium sp.]|nr:hypothetical protein [Aquabacterium sp.]